ncbi:MAG: dTDP-4-dehydrorhamnose reductase [Coriobacteriales bacterium]|jgi:dTDP-4-dehydrorhamnose reductase|nr:dTDP-4-dehydrorhamnose reductase [Coriobacteriales bacterium]
MPLNILVTGANGQMGNELRSVLASKTAQIGPVPTDYHDARVTFAGAQELNIADAQAVERFVGNGGFDLIFNCAAYTDVDGCETNQERAYAVNAEGPRNLARAAQRTKAALVHLSTDYVFAGDNPMPRIESDPCEPQSIYGKSKLLGEQAVAQECERHFIVRSAWLYGSAGKNFVKTIMERARSTGEIKVVNDQHGNPTTANDLSYTLLKLALCSEYGIYHCTNNGVCTWFDFASAIVDGANIPCTKLPCSTDEFPRPAKRPAYSMLDNARLRATIGDEMRPWQDALTDYLAHLKGAFV